MLKDQTCTCSGWEGKVLGFRLGLALELGSGFEEVFVFDRARYVFGVWVGVRVLDIVRVRVRFRYVSDRSGDRTWDSVTLWLGLVEVFVFDSKE